MLGDLEGALEGRAGKTFVSNVMAGNNPFSAEGREVKAVLTGLVPKLARGTFGEVGVLTDSDTRRYEKLLPTLSDPEDVRNALSSAIYRTAQRGLEAKLENMAKARVDVSGFYSDLIELKNEADRLESSAGKSRKQTPAPAAKLNAASRLQTITAKPIGQRSGKERLYVYTESDPTAKSAFSALSGEQKKQYFDEGFMKGVAINDFKF